MFFVSYHKVKLATNCVYRTSDDKIDQTRVSLNQQHDASYKINTIYV